MAGTLLEVLAVCLAAAPAGDAPEAADATRQWWRGNTHTHTLWSDGDGAPEMVADWYREHGYHFLVLSDHNVLSEGERWVTVKEKGPLTPARLERLRRRFGDGWVELRETGDGARMRLKTLAELRERFESPGRFLFIQGEEITDDFERIPVHVNGVHLAELIPPQGGSSVRDVMQRNIDAVLAQGRRLGRPTLAHVNHPNFGWALTAHDLAAIRGERFFEVYNGHPGVHNHGDGTHPSLESMWDVALTVRMRDTDLGVLFGLATDDAHHYFERGTVTPGRGWVMVESATLDAAAIVEALKAGRFYASSGVFLERVDFDGSRLSIAIRPEPGVRFTTRFIGTRRDAPTEEIGVVLAETQDTHAVYELAGDELYVRATITSSRRHPNPHREGDLEQAWVQPVRN